jgi:hypothetical protein
LIVFIAEAQIISLNIFIYLVVICWDNSSFDWAGLQLVIVHILGCLGHHFKHIEMLLFTQLKNFLQLLCSHCLSIGSHMIHSFSYNKSFLLTKSIQISLTSKNSIFLRSNGWLISLIVIFFLDIELLCFHLFILHCLF